MALVVLLQTGRVAAEATVDRLQEIEIDAQVIDEPNVFVKLTAGGNYQVRVVVPEEDLERARAELARWEVESGPRIEALAREVRRGALRALRAFGSCVLASVAFGGIVYALARWSEARAVRRAVETFDVPPDGELRLAGDFLSHSGNGATRLLHLGTDNRFALEELVESEGKRILRDGSEPEQGTWSVRLDSLELHSQARPARSARILSDGEYFTVVLDGVRYDQARSFDSFDCCKRY